MAGVRVANSKGLMALVVAVLVMCGGGLVASESEQVPLVPAVYVFGDSLVDVGNNGQYPPPYGIDFHGDGLNGRASNGYTISDYISMRLGFEMSPPPYKSLTLETNDQILGAFRGVNYASGGSGILNTTRLMNNSLSLAEQVEFFRVTESNMTENARSELSQSLFLICSGGNDMFAFMLDPTFPDDPFVDNLLSNFTEHLENLYSLGARRFGIIDVPPIGCVPIRRAQPPYWPWPNICAPRPTDRALRFNDMLRARMESLAADRSDMTYSVGSSFNLLKEFTRNKEAYNFTNVIGACCGGGLFGAKILCDQPGATVCENRDNYLYWDYAHSSQATAKLGAAMIFAESSVERGFATPINFQELVSPTDGSGQVSSS